ATLEHAGFVHRNGANRYAPGTRLVQIGLSAVRSVSVYDVSEPHLRRLSEASGETANLAVRADADNAVYLRQVVSPHSIHHASWLGRMLPLKKTAIGAALLGGANAKGYVERGGRTSPPLPDLELEPGAPLDAPEFPLVYPRPT
ncbi:MAG: IclR family transcriptional regulator domain-containing protein, partial [Burkholderiales bacterium]